MTEIEYRLKCLKRHQGKFDGKRIVLYGIADNASAIIHKFPEQNIIALLDQQQTEEREYNQFQTDYNAVLFEVESGNYIVATG